MPITIRRIKTEVAHAFNVSVAELCGNSREYRIAHPRAFAVMLARDLIKPVPSFARIGRELGGRDHSTIHTLYHRAPILIDQHPPYYDKIKAVKQALRNQP